MHVHNEHLAHTEMKTRLKRSFGTVGLSSTLQQDAPLPVSTNSHPPSPPPTHANIAGIPQIPMTLFIPYGGHPDNPPNQTISDDAREPPAQDTPTDDQPTQLLSTIIQQFIKQGELDNVEPEDPVPGFLLTQYPPVPLEHLFDFSRSYWVKYHQRTKCRSLNEELEVYNLLDADLPGEEGAEVAVDDTAGDILTLHV